MINVVPLTKEYIKKFNIFGVDMSVGLARYGTPLGLKSFQPNTYQSRFKNINYLYDHEEINNTITHRLIVWRFKFETKTIVSSRFQFA